MSTSHIVEKIDHTIELIFDCKFQEVITNTIDIIEYIENNNVFLNKENDETWKQIIEYISVGLQNKDYLFIADLLKHELKHLLEKENLM